MGLNWAVQNDTNGNFKDARLNGKSRRPLPFDSALPNLRMNRAVARFTNSKAESTAKSRRDAGATKAAAGRFDMTELGSAHRGTAGVFRLLGRLRRCACLRSGGPGRLERG